MSEHEEPEDRPNIPFTVEPAPGGGYRYANSEGNEPTQDLTDYSLDSRFMNEAPPFVLEGPNPTLSEILDSIRSQEDLERIDAGAEQIKNAMVLAEDEAAQSPDHHAVHNYTGTDVGLRVEVTVEDHSDRVDASALAYRSLLDERDANRPYVPLTWRSGDGSEHFMAPIEIRDPSGNLIGNVAASDIQITYHFEPGLALPVVLPGLTEITVEGIVVSDAGRRIFEEMERDFLAAEARAQGLIPIEVRDLGGNLEGAPLQDTIVDMLHAGNPDPWIQLRVNEANAERRARGEPPLPAIVQNWYRVMHEGFSYEQNCELCGQPIGATDGHEVQADGTADRWLIVTCRR